MTERTDTSRVTEAEHVGAAVADHHPVIWKARWKLEKRWGDDPEAEPYEVLEGDENLLMYGGASCLWQCLIGNGSGTGGLALTFFNNANAALGVGDSATAEAATQTDLQAATNKLRKAMDATYPLHTDGATSPAATITFRSTFATTDANWVWNEWGTFNSPTAATGRMLNRKVVAMGTKTSAAAWTFTVTISIS